MPLQIGSQFREFVTFAEAAKAAGNLKAVARLDGSPQLESSDGSPRTVSASTSDKAFAIFRSREDKRLNASTRELFMKTVVEMFHGEENIPKEVQDALLMKDYGADKPLTARRIMAVKEAIDKVVEAGVAAEMALLPTTCDKVCQRHPDIPRPQLERLVNAAIETCNGDPTAIELISSIVENMVVSGTGAVRTPEEMKAKVGAIMDNISELRTAEKTCPGALKAGITTLTSLGGKTFARGIFSELAKISMRYDIASLFPSANPSMTSLHKAFKALNRHQGDISRALDAQRGELGTDEVSAATSFLVMAAMSRLSEAQQHKAFMAVSSPNATKLTFFYMDIASGNVRRLNVPEGPLRQLALALGTFPGSIHDNTPEAISSASGLGNVAQPTDYDFNEIPPGVVRDFQ